MNLPDALTAVVDVARETVSARSWFYGAPHLVPVLYPAVWVQYNSTDPQANGNSTRSPTSGKLKRNSRTRLHHGTLYVLVSEGVQTNVDMEVAQVSQDIMDAFDQDETLRGLGDVDRTQTFQIGSPVSIRVPLYETGPLVNGISAPFTLHESL